MRRGSHERPRRRGRVAEVVEEVHVHVRPPPVRERLARRDGDVEARSREEASSGFGQDARGVFHRRARELDPVRDAVGEASRRGLGRERVERPGVTRALGGGDGMGSRSRTLNCAMVAE